MWKYIMFDLDGTITNSQEGILNCIQYALEEMGWDIPEKQTLLRFIGPPLMTSFQEILGMTPQQAKFATQKYRERYHTVGLFEATVYPGIPGLLSYLYEKGYRISVATSKPEEYTNRILEHFGLKKYFHEITGDTLQGERNTKQAVIEESLRRLHVSEEEKSKVLMIGDRKYDILGAKACGVCALGVYFGFAEPGELEKAGADHTVQTVEELVHFFDKQIV